jgi:hypothetical protein
LVAIGSVNFGRPATGAMSIQRRDGKRRLLS